MTSAVQYKVKSEELSETLLQLMQVRNTEPEEQLAEMKAQYEAASKGVWLLLTIVLSTHICSSARGAHQGAYHTDCPSYSHVRARSRVDRSFSHA